MNYVSIQMGSVAGSQYLLQYPLTHMHAHMYVTHTLTTHNIHTAYNTMSYVQQVYTNTHHMNIYVHIHNTVNTNTLIHKNLFKKKVDY